LQRCFLHDRPYCTIKLSVAVCVSLPAVAVTVSEYDPDAVAVSDASDATPAFCALQATMHAITAISTKLKDSAWAKYLPSLIPGFIANSTQIAIITQPSSHPVCQSRRFLPSPPAVIPRFGGSAKRNGTAIDVALAPVGTSTVNCCPTVTLDATVHAPPAGAPEHDSAIAPVKLSAEKSSIVKVACAPAATLWGTTGAKQKSPVAVPLSVRVCGDGCALSFNVSVAVRFALAFTHAGANVITIVQLAPGAVLPG